MLVIETLNSRFADIARARPAWSTGGASSNSPVTVPAATA